MKHTNLFDSVMVFSDIHLGLRHNSVTHLDDCMDYIEWFIKEAKIRNADTCICMGDFFHHRNTINSQTLEYGIKVFERLNESFKKTYITVGNHDLYWRSSRAVTSIKFTNLFPNVVLIDKITEIGNVALIPWLVDDEWKTVSKIKTKYIFGHLELPGFKMNAQVEMPDHGELNSTHFINQDLVFSGHFHKRQSKGKVTYIGNPFGHNFADVWDFERGAMFMKWSAEPEFIDYKDGPRFININLSALMANPDLYLKPKTYLQVVLDVDITYEEATYLRETFISQYNIREFKLIRSQDNTDISQEFKGEINMKTVDEIVTEQLLNIDTQGSFDTAKLIEIYDRL